MTGVDPVQIAYGPPGAVEHGAAVARGLTAFGLAVPMGVVFALSETLALDTGRSIGDWYQLVAISMGVGLLLCGVLGRAAANLGASIGKSVAVLGGLSAASWIALFNVGDTTAVAVLVAVGLGTSVPLLLLSGVDALGYRPAARPIDAIASPAAAAAAGATVGAFVMFVDPALVWSDVTAAGALVAAAGVMGRLRLPSAVRGATPRPTRTKADRSPTGLRVLLAGSLGIAAAPVVRIGPFLEAQWQAGVRYHLLTVAIAGAAALALLVAMMWLPLRRRRSGATEVDDLSRMALLVAGAVLLVAISETLPGVVAGTGLAAGAALAGVALLGAAGARGDRSQAGAITSAGVVGIGAWVLTWTLWPTLVESVGSERIALAIVAVPALTLGGLATARPLSDAEPATATVAPGPATVIDLADHAGANGSAPHPAPLLLDASGVEYSYGAVQVLFGVDLQVRAGECVALLGTNGAGKTTFLRTVSGLADPSAGSIRLAGGDLTSFSSAERVLLGINQIAAGAAVAPDLSVAENLAMFGHTLRPKEAREGRARALEVFPRLAERSHQRAASLSGGERQMLSLAKSLVLRPRLLIVDELTLGLAPVAVASLVPVIERLHDEGSAVLLVEQSVHLALDLADRAYCMEKGRIVYESDADTLRADEGLLEAVYLEGISAALEHRDRRAGSGAA